MNSFITKSNEKNRYITCKKWVMTIEINAYIFMKNREKAIDERIKRV